MLSPSLKHKWIPLAALVVATAVVYFSFQWALEAVVHNRQVVMVPDLSGKGVVEALNLLSQTHLGLVKDGEQFDKRFPAGTIIHQNPPAGMMVREGRLVRITLSQGGETLFVPDLVSQPLRNAQTSLQNVGLSMGEIERRPSLRFEKDQVVATDPPAGSVVAKNGLVNLVVSDGPPAADVLLAPDFIGKNLSEAREWASAHQVAVSVRDENDITRTPGEVTMQAPTADSPIHAGDTLTLVANTGAVPSEGPHVHFDVPAQGTSDVAVRVLIIDETGEHEAFRKTEAPGTHIDFAVQPKGRAHARIFINGVAVEEEDLQ